ASSTETTATPSPLTAICAMTSQNDVTGRVWMSAASASPMVASLISIEPFTSRKAPPRISTRSRTEMPWPNSWNRSLVRPASHASVSSSAMRVMQATAMPNLRATSRRCGGSLLTAMEMKTRLSMPSTISIALRVSRVIQTSGSSSISYTAASVSVIRWVRCSGRQPRPQQRGPGQHHQQHGEEHGCRAHVLGPPGEFVLLRAIALDDRLDGGVQQLDDQHQDHRRDQQHALDTSGTQPPGQRREDDEQVHLEPE